MTEHALVVPHSSLYRIRVENAALVEVVPPLAFKICDILLAQLLAKNGIIFNLLDDFAEDFSVYFLRKF